MKKEMIAMLAAVMGLSVAAAEVVFPAEFQKIAKSNAANAAEQYAALAEKAKNPAQKDQAYYAAFLQALGRKKFDDAQKYLNSVQDKQMKTLGAMETAFKKRQWQEIALPAENEKLETWRGDLISRAAYLRAYGHAWNKKTHPLVEKDIALAVSSSANPAEKYAMICQCASSIYESGLFRDNAKELALLQSAEPCKKATTQWYLQRVECRIAVLLGLTGKADEGLKYLAAYKVDKAESRRSGVAQAYGDLYAMKGDKAKAKEYYEEAIRLYPPWKVFVEPKLKKLAK